MRTPVKVLMDTAALDSFIVDSGSSVIICEMGLTVFPVPQHKLIFSDLVQGEVFMGIHRSFPIDGVHVILRNDLAGERVWRNV